MGTGHVSDWLPWIFIELLATWCWLNELLSVGVLVTWCWAVGYSLGVGLGVTI